jgi:response regulator RpfG family c-di-GMP phosphodiesterase
MNKILLVDDDENILAAYKRVLRNEFQVFTSIDAPSALEILKVHNDFAVVVSDYNMPEMKGIEFLSLVKENQPNVVRILLTGNAELQMAIDAVNEGNIFRFLTKPCSNELLQNVIRGGVSQYKLITAEKELLEKTLKGSIKLLIDILAVTNPTVFNRAMQIREMAKKLLHRLNIQETWDMDIACLLSQIGCVGVPADILDKRLQGIKISDKEEEIYYSHADIGKSLLMNIPRLEKIADSIALQYKSYSDLNLLKNNYSDEKIIFIAKLLRLLNDYFFLIEKGMEPVNAIKFILEEGNLYDPNLLQAFEAELLGLQDGYIVESLSINQLKEGMILAEDLFDKLNYKLLPKGVRLSGIYVVKLINYGKLKGLVEPIKVFVKTV